MTLESTLFVIQNLRAQIEQWGITAETLIAVALVATVFLMVSLREVMLWFLKISHLRDDVRSLREEIRELKALMAEKPLIIEKEVSTESETPKSVKVGADSEAPAESQPSRFRLDH